MSTSRFENLAEIFWKKIPFFDLKSLVTERWYTYGQLWISFNLRKTRLLREPRFVFRHERVSESFLGGGKSQNVFETTLYVGELPYNEKTPTFSLQLVQNHTEQQVVCQVLSFLNKLGGSYENTDGNALLFVFRQGHNENTTPKQLFVHTQDIDAFFTRKLLCILSFP